MLSYSLSRIHPFAIMENISDVDPVERMIPEIITLDKKEYYITKKNVFPFVLHFMNLPCDTKLTFIEILQNIFQFIKKNKNQTISSFTSDSIEFYYDKDIRFEEEIEQNMDLNTKSFIYINNGSLGYFFKNIKNIMKERGILTNEIELANQIKVTKIISFIKYCFLK